MPVGGAIAIIVGLLQYSAYRRLHMLPMESNRLRTFLHAGYIDTVSADVRCYSDSALFLKGDVNHDGSYDRNLARNI